MADIELVGIAGQQLAAGGMAEDADVGILDGAEDARRHLFARLAEERVHAGDDDVHLGEDRVGEIEGAVAKDVDLDAGEDADFSGHLGIDFADVADVGERARIVEAVGHGEILRVVGDGDVLEAAGEGGFGHLADGVACRRSRRCACGHRRGCRPA